MSVPVLFLDFDGVLHPQGTPTLDESGRRLVQSVELFRWLPELTRILAPAPQIAIVVTSDWSLFCDDQRLRLLLGDLGARYIGATERLAGKSRAERIWDHVDRHSIQSWLAVDDDQSVRNAAEFEPRFVSCDPASGISALGVQRQVALWVTKVR